MRRIPKPIASFLRLSLSLSLPARAPAALRQRGLSTVQMLAILVVVVVIGVVAIPRLSSMVNHAHSPEITTAEQTLQEIEQALQRYRQDNGRYPSNEQGLLALIIRPSRPPAASGWKTGGYIDRLPRDPWGNPYQYRLSDDGSQPDVFSYGAKGPDGGDDSDAIIRASH